MEINQLLKEQMSTIQSAIDTIEEQYKLCTEKQSQLDMLLVDIYHEIELDKLSAPEMMSKYKELKAVLKLRRKYKDAVEHILIARQYFNPKNVHTTLKGIDTMEKKDSRRTYSHRIKKEVRAELISEMNSL